MLSPAPGSRDGLEEGIGKLCDTLGLPPHDDHEEVLQVSHQRWLLRMRV